MINNDQETLELFKKVVESDLLEYAKKISIDRNIPIDQITPYINKILEKPIADKLNLEYRNINRIIYKKDLDRFTLLDLSEIAKSQSLKSSGNKLELVNRITKHLNLKDITDDELKRSKSFTSKPLKIKKKESPTKTTSTNQQPYNIISYDTDDD